MKKIIMSLFLILLLGFSEVRASDIISEIKNFETIVNKGGNVKGQIQAKVLRLYDYDYFFSKALGNEDWNSLNATEKQKMKLSYNAEFVNKYFGDLMACHNLKISTLTQNGSVITGTYKCSVGEPSGLKFIVYRGKIADIQMKGMSFVRNESVGVKRDFRKHI